MIRQLVTARALLTSLTLIIFVGSVQAQVWPEFIITDINITPTNPAVGETIQVEVVVVNDGTAIPAQDPVTTLWLDNPVWLENCDGDDSAVLGVPFPAGTTRLFNFNVVYDVAGSFTLRAFIDCGNSITEQEDELNNNQFTRTIAVGLGDLTIDSIAPSVADPVPGQPFMVNVTVRNNGPAILNSVAWQVGVRYDATEPQNCGEIAQAPLLQGFPANSTTVVQFGPVSYPTPGDYPVWAWVDCVQFIDESDDNNNKLFATLDIGAPDLVIDSVTISDTTPNIGDTIDVDVVVRNVGSADASAFEVWFTPDRATEPSYEVGCDYSAPNQVQFVNPGLTVGQSTTLTYQVSYNEARQQRPWAFVDSCQSIQEAREDNNVQGATVNVANPTPGYPDLIIESITAQTLQTNAYGDVVQFDVVVTNVGLVSSGVFRVGDYLPSGFPGVFPSSYVVIGSPGPRNGGSSASIGTWNDCTWRTREIGSLLPNTSATVSFWQSYALGGTYSFTATADVCGTGPNYRVLESSEDNNFQTIEIEVSGCTADADLDGWCDDEDFCPNTPDDLNNDSDGDGVGDVCDNDDDNDGVDDVSDCEPRNPSVFPGNVENCTDGIDNNCDGQIDEGAQTWYRDADGDGFGSSSDTFVDCTPPAGYIATAGDCDDTNAAVFPGNVGPCDDGLDNDCDGIVDNELPVWGRDADGDGYTVPGDIIADDDGVCDGRPAGYSLVSAIPDPDDADFQVPEPVVVSPATVDLEATQSGRLSPIVLELRRNGLEVFDYAINVTYESVSTGWLVINPLSGSSVDGVALINLSGDGSELSQSIYEARLAISINGAATFDVPLQLQVRDPIIHVVHNGRGGGRAWANYFDNAADTSVYLGNFDTEEGTYEFSASVPFGEGVYLYDSPDDCSYSEGLSIDGSRVEEDQENARFGPILVEDDTEFVMTFQPNALLCSSCGFIMITLNIVGVRRSLRKPNAERR